MYFPIERTRCSSPRWILMDRAGYWKICAYLVNFASYLLTCETRYKIKDYPGESQYWIILHVSQASFQKLYYGCVRMVLLSPTKVEETSKALSDSEYSHCFPSLSLTFLLVLQKRPMSNHRSSFRLFQHWKWLIIMTLTRSSWYRISRLVTCNYGLLVLLHRTRKTTCWFPSQWVSCLPSG